MAADLDWLNSLATDRAFAEFHACCGSSRWAKEMINNRPFGDVSSVKECARDIWWTLDTADWLEAFRSHPKIGEKKAEGTVSQKARLWSGDEQSGVRDATRETSGSLATLNKEYEAKFGFIFIVCATGKSSEEMLAILRERLMNDPTQELRNAATEQAKITELRLDKLLNP